MQKSVIRAKKELKSSRRRCHPLGALQLGSGTGGVHSHRSRWRTEEKEPRCTSVLAGNLRSKSSSLLSVRACPASPVKGGGRQRRFQSARVRTASAERTSAALVREHESHLDAQCIFHFPRGSNQKNL